MELSRQASNIVFSVNYLAVTSLASARRAPAKTQVKTAFEQVSHIIQKTKRVDNGVNYKLMFVMVVGQGYNGLSCRHDDEIGSE